MKLTTINDSIKINYNIDVNTMMCYRFRKFVNIHVQGSIAEQYTKLRDYCEKLNHSEVFFN